MSMSKWSEVAGKSGAATKSQEGASLDPHKIAVEIQVETESCQAKIGQIQQAKESKGHTLVNSSSARNDSDGSLEDAHQRYQSLGDIAKQVVANTQANTQAKQHEAKKTYTDTAQNNATDSATQGEGSSIGLSS